MKIRMLTLITAFLGIMVMQLNAQGYIDATTGALLENPPPTEITGAARLDCQNNNGYTVVTTGSSTPTFSYPTPATTNICAPPSAAFPNANGFWSTASATGFVTYTFNPAICAATVSYSAVNGPGGSGQDIGQLSIDAGVMSVNNVCGAVLSGGNTLTCNLTNNGAWNPFGDVTVRVASTQPFTTITLTNIGGQTGWVQGDPCQFIIEDCCTPPDVRAVLVDEDGNEQTTFCYLEDVYLDASASSNYDEYFISVWEYDDLGNTINYARFDPWWKPAPVTPNPFNISAYANWLHSPNNQGVDWMFCPGGNYAIQFALRNECDGWEAIMLDFKVDCCREYAAKADFELIIPASSGSTYTMEAVNYDKYEDAPGDCPVTHAWCVYKTDDDGTLNYITTIFGPNFTYTGQDGVLYTVVHKVESPCGEDCYAVEIFRDALLGEDGSRGEFVSQSVECPEDCDPDCEAPTNLNCEVVEGQHLLTWDAVIGATSYIVEITFNDPDCCEGAFPTQFRYYPINNWQFIPIQTDKCWSWRVLTVCGEERSEWSEKICIERGATCSDRPCETPTHLTCLEIEGQLQLSWSVVASATSYIVEITYDDPECCHGNLPTQFRYYPTTNSVIIPLQTERCWSWRVQAICGEERSEWSQKVCMEPGIRCFSIADGRSGGGQSIVDQPISLSAYPNPFDDIINFEISQANDTQHLLLIDLLGKVIMDQEISPLSTRFELNTGSLIPGIYYATLKQSDGEIKTIKIVKK